MERQKITAAMMDTRELSTGIAEQFEVLARTAKTYSGKKLPESVKYVQAMQAHWDKPDIETINGFLAAMVETAKDLVGQFIDAMAQKFAEIYSEASGWVQDNIITPITNMGQSLYDAGKGLIDRMWQGLKDAWSKVTEWWDGLAFSNKTAHATVETSGSHKNGLDYVPFDGYVAELHRGESVLTAEEASLWRAGLTGNRSGGGNFYLTQNIESVPQTPVELAATTEAYFQQARWAMAW